MTACIPFCGGGAKGLGVSLVHHIVSCWWGWWCLSYCVKVQQMNVNKSRHLEIESFFLYMDINIVHAAPNDQE